MEKNKDHRKIVTSIIPTIIISVMLLSSSSVVFFPPQEVEAYIADKKTISVASWTISNFGDREDGEEKITNEIIMESILGVVSMFDVVFIQELVREVIDPDAEIPYDPNNPYVGFHNLCTYYLVVANYACKHTGSVGDGTEGYGVIYKKNSAITSISVEDTGHTSSIVQFPMGVGEGYMKHPPMEATIMLGDDEFHLIVYNVHTNIHETPREIALLSESLLTAFARSYFNLIVLGNLNAGSDYYPGGFVGNPNDFPNVYWNQLIDDGISTVFNDVDGPQANDRMIRGSTTIVSGTIDFQIIDQLAADAIFNGVGYNAGTPFNQVYAGADPSRATLTDHKLIATEFYYGGIESTDENGDLKEIFMDYKNPPDCDEWDDVYIRGEGFAPYLTMFVYITPYPDNQNYDRQYQQSNQHYQLTNIYNNVTVTTDQYGNIENTHMGLTPNTGHYNVIVDVNRDGYFTNSIDVVDVFNGYGFKVINCTKAETQTVEATKAGKRTRDGISDDDIGIAGSDLDADNPSKKRKVWLVTPMDTGDMDTDFIYDLSENSVFSSDVLITSQGVFDRIITWDNPIPGMYNIILDMDDDNTYNPAIDIIDYIDEIGLIIFENRAGHNGIVHLGDNGFEREVYNSKIAKNIYTLAKDLPADKDVDIYTISEKLLKDKNPGWSTWEDSNNVDLFESAVAVYGSEFKHTAHTSSDGTLFLSTWKNPSKIYDQSFINNFGKKYNIVIDVNRDGFFDYTIDTVDTHDIGDMKNWFRNNDSLDSSADGNPAVSEYKEYLNSKLDLEKQLDSTNIYDDATRQASFEYLCSENITRDLFELIKAGSQVGFRVLGEKEYYAGRDMDTSRHVYDNVEFDGLDVHDEIISVMVGADGSQILVDDLNVEKGAHVFICQVDDLTINNITTDDDSLVNIEADKITYEGEIDMSNSCTNFQNEVVIRENTNILGKAIAFYNSLGDVSQNQISSYHVLCP